MYLVTDLNLNVKRALKCIPLFRDFSGEAAREAAILKDLRHPAIPIIYDIEYKEDCVCIIEEYVEGMSLKSVLLRNRKFSVKEITDLASELCDIVGYLHDKGVYHHDIKPDNIILNHGNVRLLDYGSATYAGEYRGIHMGTRGYAAPEMYGNGTAGAGSDIYSIGAVMYSMAGAGQDDFSLSDIYPQEIRHIVEKCLAHSDRERISSVSELKDRLLEVGKKNALGQVSLSICFIGAYEHCGTTRCAIMAARSLARPGKKVLLAEKNNSGHFARLAQTSDKVVFNRGKLTVDGLDMLPYYNGCVNTDWEERYGILISDYGSAEDADIRKLTGADHICVVTGVRPYELDRAEKVLIRVQSECPGCAIHTLLNMTDAAGYEKAVRKRQIINPLRVPYIPDLRKVGGYEGTNEKNRFFRK